MNKKTISEERTLANSFVSGFDPVTNDKWIEELIGELNWPKTSDSEDVDVSRNLDDKPSYDLINSDYIKKMTDKFIENGGEINILPADGNGNKSLNPVGCIFKVKNSNSNPKEWDVDDEYLKYQRREHHLSPFNIFWKYSERTDGVRYEN